MTFVPGQLLTADQLNALQSGAFPAGSVSTYSATLLAGVSQAAWFVNLGLPSAAPGSANGIATLDGTGAVPLAQLPASITGAMFPKGGWNASTNNPALASGVGTKGFFYVVTNAGSTTLDGNSTWSVGDCLFFDGTVWRKINASGNVSVPSTNITDSTAVGRALLTAATVPAQRVDLNIDQATIVADTNVTITNLMESVVWGSLTAPRTGTLSAASTFNAGQAVFIYDESGNCNSTNTITLLPSGADTINGLSSYVMRGQNAGVIAIRASTAKWTLLPLMPETVGFRNRIINGDMRVDQRNGGTAQTITAGTSGAAYTIDRFFAYCTGANITGQQIVGPAPDQFNYQFTVGAAVTGINFAQRIEAANCFDLAGNTATLSVKLANSVVTTVTWTASYANTTNTFGTVASPTKTTIASGTFTVTSSLARYVARIAVPSAAITGIEIVLSVGSQASGTWTIAAMQFEPGSFATSFERILVSSELENCQRYYWQTPSSFTPVANAPFATNGFSWMINFPVQMRAVPLASSSFSSNSNCTPSISANQSWGNLLLTSTAAGLMFSTYNAGNSFNAEL